MSNPLFTTIKKDSSPTKKLVGVIDYMNYIS